MSGESGALSSTRSRGRSIASAGAPAGGTLLLASAASLDDVEAALAGGAAIVDLKDPEAGPLGACDVAILAGAAAIRRRVDPRRPLSAAIGAARDPAAVDRAAAAARLGYDFVKAGLDGEEDPEQAARLLAAIVAAIRSAGSGAAGSAAAGGRPATRLIAATYADAGAVGALAPDLLADVAQRAGGSGCLLDTARKDGRTLFDHRGAEAVARFVVQARGRGLLVALAGSFGEEEAARALALGPDIIGLRGALCAGGRSGRLDPERVRRFAALVESAGWKASAR